MFIRDLAPGDQFKFHGHMSVNTVVAVRTEANMTRVTYKTGSFTSEYARVSLSTVLPVEES